MPDKLPSAKYLDFVEMLDLLVRIEFYKCTLIHEVN